MKILTAGWTGFLIVLSTAINVHAIPMADVELLGGNKFLQVGSVTNASSSGAEIIKFVYSFGTPADGIATWDNEGADATGRTIADPVSDRYFQTIIYDGLAVQPGDTFTFGGQDIDQIATLDPLVITVAIDEVGTSLRNAFVQVFWSNGTDGITPLLEQSWRETQQLHVNAVPEPGSFVLVVSGIAGLGLLIAERRRSRAGNSFPG